MFKERSLHNCDRQKYLFGYGRGVGTFIPALELRAGDRFLYRHRSQATRIAAGFAGGNIASVEIGAIREWFWAEILPRPDRPGRAIAVYRRGLPVRRPPPACL